MRKKTSNNDSDYDVKTGKPLDKSYLACNLPQFLQDDIDQFVKGEAEKSSLMDCFWGELYGSINSAMIDGQISEEQAHYLRGKYLFDYERDSND